MIISWVRQGKKKRLVAGFLLWNNSVCHRKTSSFPLATEILTAMSHQLSNLKTCQKWFSDICHASPNWNLCLYITERDFERLAECSLQIHKIGVNILLEVMINCAKYFSWVEHLNLEECSHIYLHLIFFRCTWLFIQWEDICGHPWWSLARWHWWQVYHQHMDQGGQIQRSPYYCCQHW